MEPTAPALSVWEALAYGVIQGVTEFLPVSSSGHLALAHKLGLGSIPKQVELPFDVLLHAGTLVAIAIAFRRDIVEALRWRPQFYVCVVISIVPAGLAGAFGKKYVEAAGESWWVLGACYLFTALLLGISERISLRMAPTQTSDEVPGHTLLHTVTRKQALWVGLLQVLALLPGVSRSGSTISAGLLGGMRPGLAVSYSFMVGLPLIAAAAGKDAIDGGYAALLEQVGLLPLVVAFIASLVVGVASIAALKLVVGKRRLIWFAAYCGVVALLCFGLGVAGA